MTEEAGGGHDDQKTAASQRIMGEIIIRLIKKESEHYQQGSSEYIRLLCGYLYCLGDAADVDLMEKAKHINFDVGCMIDGEWIESLKNGGIQTDYVNSREDIIQGFIDYYSDFSADDFGSDF